MYGYLYDVCTEFEPRMPSLRLTPEEMLLECVTVLDDLKEHPDGQCRYINKLWNVIGQDLKARSLLGFDDGELDCGTTLIYCAILSLLDQCGADYADATIMQRSFLKSEPVDELQMQIESTCSFFLVFGNYAQPLSPYVMNYMQNPDEWQSEELKDLLKKLSPEGRRRASATMASAPTVPADSGSTDVPMQEVIPVSQLTNRQLIFLFEAMLDVQFTSTETNLKAMAHLLAAVSGRSEQSLRTKINEIKALRDSAKSDLSIQQDKRRVIELLRKINADTAPALAQKIERGMEV